METGKRQGMLFFYLLIVTIAILVYLFFQGMQLAPTVAELYVGAIIYIICCIPTFVYFNRRELNIPSFPYYCVVYFIYYGAGVFINQKLFLVAYYPPEMIERTLLLSLTGIVSLLIAFYGSKKPLESMLPRLSINMDPRKAYSLALRIFFFSLISPLIFFRGETGVNVSGIRHFINTLPLLSIVMLFTLFIKGTLSFKGKFWLWLIFVPMRFMFLLSGGGFAGLVFEASALFYVYFYLRQRIPLLGSAIIIVLFFFIWGARDSYRELTWQAGPYSGLNTYSKSLIYMRLMWDRFTGNSPVYDNYTPGERLAIRTNQLITFIYTVNTTPAYVPYWGGYTYKSFFYFMIPRFVFPDKPKKTIGSEFGQRYQLLDQYDTTTSYNLPILVEFYINFGEVGIFVGMLLMGLILRAMYCVVNHPKCGDGGMTIGAILFTIVLNMESDFSLVFGNVLQYMLLFYFLMKHINIKEDTTKAAQAISPG